MPCVPVDQLHRLVAGRLDAADAERLGRHLDGCPACLAAARRLPPADALLSAVRDDSGEPPDLARLLERLEGLVSTVDPSPTADLTAQLAPAAAPDEIGRLGPYRVRRVLGKGGMGVVYEAFDPRLGRLVAVKAMRPRVRDTDAVRRFLAEARAAAALQHDHVVAVHDVGDEGGIPYLTMPLLRGESLEQRLARDGALPVAEAVRLARQAAEGLAAAHAVGLVHRDVKPSNLWLEEGLAGPRVKLLDFGLARSVENDDAGLAVAGTPGYMSPEQAVGGSVDGRADLFALGCVLYRMLTGRAAFCGTDLASTLAEVATQQPPPPSTVRPEVPAPLSALVLALLAKEPGQRPASAREVARTLDVLGRRRERRTRRGAVLAVVTAALVLGALALSLGPSRSPRLDPAPAADAAQVRAFAGHLGPVWAVAFLPGGREAVSARDDGTLRLWDVASGRNVRALVELPANNLKCVAAAPRGGLLACLKCYTMANRRTGCGLRSWRHWRRRRARRRRSGRFPRLTLEVTRRG